MGFFSWKTSDTQESIANQFSCRETFPVALIYPDNTRVIEDNYEGYGVFGGVDIYEAVAKLNGGSTREEGVSMVFKDNSSGEFVRAAAKGLKLPKLAEDLEADYDTIPYPTNCEYQGYFYADEFSDEEDEDADDE